MEGENDKVRVMFGGEIVLAVHHKFCREPGGYNATSLKDWSRINAGVVIFEFKLFFEKLSSCHGKWCPSHGIMGHTQDRGWKGCVGTFKGELNFTKIMK